MRVALRDRAVDVVVLALLNFVVLPGAALAYLDPGTGSLLWQVALAGGLTLLYLGKRYWHRLRALLHLPAGRPAGDNEPGDVED